MAALGLAILIVAAWVLWKVLAPSVRVIWGYRHELMAAWRKRRAAERRANAIAWAYALGGPGASEWAERRLDEREGGDVLDVD